MKRGMGPRKKGGSVADDMKDTHLGLKGYSGVRYQ